MRKKILHVAEAFGGGVVTFLANLANEQCDEYDVYIAYGIRPETHANFKSFFDPRINFIKVDHFHQEISVLEVVKSILEIKQLISKIEPSVIHMHSSQSGVITKIASIGYKCAKVYSPHGFSFLKQDVSVPKRKIFELIERVFAIFNCELVGSSYTEYQEAQRISKKTSFVPNGINIQSLTQYIPLKKENGKAIVGMVGRALPQKNPSFFNEIAKLMPDVQFEWIGDGQLRNQLTSPNIHIVGWGPREEALEYVSMCDVYIMTSLWEGMPLSLLEAMYLKKACVVTDVVGNRDVIKDGLNGYVCDSVDMFVEKIRFLISNPSISMEMGKRAHEDVIMHYTSSVMANRYKEIYNRVAENNS